MIKIEALAFRQWEPPNVSDIDGRVRLNITDSVSIVVLAHRENWCALGFYGNIQNTCTTTSREHIEVFPQIRCAEIADI